MAVARFAKTANARVGRVAAPVQTSQSAKGTTGINGLQTNPCGSCSRPDHCGDGATDSSSSAPSISAATPCPAIALVQERAVREKHVVVEQLQLALRSRVVIEQAKGVLAERLHIGVDAAFACMRAYARAHNQRLSVVAEEVAGGRLGASELRDGTRGVRGSHAPS